MARLSLVVLIIWLAACATGKPPTSTDTPVNVYRQSADAALNAGDYQRAVALAERGLRTDRYAADLYLIMARAYQAQGNSEQARNFARLGLRYAGEDETLRADLQRVADASQP